MLLAKSQSTKTL